MSEGRPSTATLIRSQLGYQNKIFIRNPVAAFFTVAFPLMFFVIFAAVFGNEEIEYLGVTTAQYFAPALAVFAAVSATYTNLAVGTAYQRDEGILKRVRGTPMPPAVYMGGKILSAILIAAISVAIMLAVGVGFYGVEIYLRTLPAALLTFFVGVGCFAALGLAVAALVSSGPTATAVANATLLPLAFFSGVFFPPSEDYPAWIEAVAGFFPLKHFVEPFAAAFNPQYTGAQFDWVSIGIMLLWGAGGVFVATRYFKWEKNPDTSRQSRRDKKAAAAA